MGNIESTKVDPQGQIAINEVGPEWSYKANFGVRQIIISHDEVIYSIMFKSEIDLNYSPKFGGDGGSQTDKIDIDFPSEYLTGISGTHRTYENKHVMSSLTLHTNQTQYGPFGHESDHPFSYHAPNRGVITGFHGRAGPYLGSIGVYTEPASSISKAIAMKQCAGAIYKNPGVFTRTPRPWGVTIGGREWDDGVFSTVKKVCVCMRKEKSSDGGADKIVVSGVQFEYEKRDGSSFVSSLHGTRGYIDLYRGDEEYRIDGKSEFLIGVEGFYGPVNGVDVIRSITFLTNNRRFGPICDEIGTYFTSLSSMASCGKVVGFHGTSGAYLNAIGVHTEYF